jgi:DeoR family suf operon transcriptional repressor
MTYLWEFANTPAGKVLKVIQLRGKATIRDVAVDLGVTTSAVRPHITQLQASGAIQAEKVREGVGRPYHLYSTTPDAHRLFHHDYGDLTRILMSEVAQSQGTDALQAVLRRVADRLASQYRDQVRGQELVDRVRAWARLLEQRGVAVELDRTSEGFVLREYGCPYQNVALENRAVCEMERQVMARLLAAGVKLTQCVLDGHHGCQFTIAGAGAE